MTKLLLLKELNNTKELLTAELSRQETMSERVIIREELKKIEEEIKKLRVITNLNDLMNNSEEDK